MKRCRERDRTAKTPVDAFLPGERAPARGEANAIERATVSAPSFKILIFLKRRPGMSVEKFRRYYEEIHVPLCLEYTQGVSRYMRRFIDPLPNPETGESGDLAYDVITELWFDDEAVFRATAEHMSTGVMPDEVVEDEKNLFDRDKIRVATVVEYETDSAVLRAS